MSFGSPFFSGVGQVSDTRFDVGIGGHGYMIDWKSGQFSRRTIDMIRQQSDTSDRPGEATLNPAGLWRRAVESWHHGAGQEWFDKPDSDPNRFHTSKGVDPWTKYGLTLLPDTSRSDSTTQTNVYLAAGAGRLYASQGGTVRVTASGGETWSSTTGLPGGAVESMASDGTTVYAAAGAAIYTTTGTNFASTYTGTATLVRYLLGRLIVASGKAIYNVTAAGAITSGTVLLDHPNTGWTWTDAGEGAGHIYLSGYAADKSMVYRTQIKSDGTGLDVAIPAASLPDGELAFSLTGYLGFVVIGTSKGVRFAVPDQDGNLTLGPLIPTTSPVLCAEGQDRFVWFGMSDYDSVSTGLGRMDLSTFTNDLTPAYASDVMSAGQGAVTSVVTYLDKLWWAVAGSGVWTTIPVTVTSGYVTSGQITYGIPDAKTLIGMDVRHDPLPAAADVTLSFSVNGGTFTVAGKSETDGTSVSPPDAFSLNLARGAFMELQATLTGGMTLRRVTLRADPAAERSVQIIVPVLLYDNVDVNPQVGEPLDVPAEFAFLTALCADRTVISYQERGYATQAVIENYQWQPYERTVDGRYFTGTFIAQLKGI